MMTLARIAAALALTACLLASVLAIPAWAAFGELIVLRGQATLIRGRITAIVTERFDLEDGDRVITAEDSKAHILLFGELAGSEAIVTENTDFNVSDLAVRRDRSPFELIAGAIRSRLLAFTGSLPFMQTPTAVTGVKGTDFIVFVRRANASEFIGIDGLIEAASRSRPEFAIRIGKRQWGEIVEGERPRPPIRVPDEIWEPAQIEFGFPGETGFGGEEPQ